MFEGIVVIGGSAGGFEATREVLRLLSPHFNWPIIVVHHMLKGVHSQLATLLDSECALPVFELEDKQMLQPGEIYVAPADYHVLVESCQTLALSIDPPLHYNRPSIDILFESAARVFQHQVVGILLSGANHDGTQGLLSIAQRGGWVLIQSPESAVFPLMPQHALRHLPEAQVLELADISAFLNQLPTRTLPTEPKP